MLRIQVQWLVTVVLSGVIGACAGETDTGGSEETAEDTNNGDTAPDGDSNGDTTEDSGGEGELACLGAISGQVLLDGAEGMEALVVVCLGVDLCFAPLVTETDGNFLWEYPLDDGEECSTHDFVEEWLHIQILALENPNDYASYSFVRHPTQAEISDQGSEDYTLDVGALSLYTLPAGGATYSPSSGATVDLFGLSFEIPPGGLVKRPYGEDADVPLEFEQPIRIFRAPLDEWDPPFTETRPDALFYIFPSFARVASPGVMLSIEPPDGWEEGDTGRLELLGGWVSSFDVDEGPMSYDYLFRTADGLCINTEETDGLEQVHDGFMADCGVAEMTGGRVVTSPLARLTWVAIYR